MCGPDVANVESINALRSQRKSDGQYIQLCNCWEMIACGRTIRLIRGT
jgi:hypothetical protein